MTDIWKIYRQACLPPLALGTTPDPNPPPCTLPPNFFFIVGWEASTPGLSVFTNGQPCFADADCRGGETCRDGTSDSVAPCGGIDCSCKDVHACTTDADCQSGLSCRDDATGSALPCTDATCVCKVVHACTTDADCTTLQQARCRDTSTGFPPCAGGACACISYPQAGFIDGARLQYMGDLDRITHVTQFGNQYGVSRDLTP
jgi:hypothetical protein